MKSARETALLILCKTEYQGAYPNLELKHMPPEMEKRDKALVTNLVYGVLSRKLTLDYILEQYSKLKIKKLSRYIHQIVRMGIYQMLFMDKIPEGVAVDESVKLARRYGHGGSAGYVNGLLRTIARSKIQYPEDGILRLSVLYSFPEWICRKWITEFGYDFTEEMLKGMDTVPQLTLRPNRLKTTPEHLAELLREQGVQAEISGNAVISSGLEVGKDSLYRQGMYTVQDRAAMAAVEELNPQPGETVLDLCAAPGGKTTYMAERMENRGRILAFDVYEHKIDLIRENAARLGIGIIEAKIGDTQQCDSSLVGIADKILCDAPCSGWGILRRKPDIKWNRKPEDDFPTLQLKILTNAAQYLKNRGQLLYSTCTVEREENEGVTNAFLKENGGFQKVYEKTFYPHIDGTDGFYICKLEKK